MNNVYKLILGVLFSFSGVALAMEGQGAPDDQINNVRQPSMTQEESDANLARIFTGLRFLNPVAADNGLAALREQQEQRNAHAVELFNQFAPEPNEDPMPPFVFSPEEQEQINSMHNRAVVQAAQRPTPIATATTLYQNIRRTVLRNSTTGRFLLATRRHTVTLRSPGMPVLDTNPNSNVGQN